MAREISAPVGKGGVNNEPDVRIVQELLNKVPEDAGGPRPPLAVDGNAGNMGPTRRSHPVPVLSFGASI